MAREESFREAVAAMKGKLAKLQAEMACADAAGNSRDAIESLGKMLQLQRAFFEEWRTIPAAPGTQTHDSHESLPPDVRHGLSSGDVASLGGTPAPNRNRR